MDAAKSEVVIIRGAAVDWLVGWLGEVPESRG